MIRAAILALAAATLALAGCVPHPPPPPRVTLAPARYGELAGWRADHVAAALPAFLKSCAALDRLPPRAPVGPGGIAGTAEEWRAPCAAAASIPPGDDDAVRHFVEVSFAPWRVGNNGEPRGLFTGYFEPELAGARHRRSRFTVPLLGRPPDLVTADLGLFRPDWRGEHIAGRVVDGRLVPYASRAAIERGALDRFHLALVWVDSAIDAYFLAVQGSGRVRLPDGRMLQLGYAGENGRRYVAIGRLLVERGALAKGDVSLQTIRAWLMTHPAEARALMDANPSYVFFRVLKTGPIGAEGVVLTPRRSLAIDPTFLPLGVPMWLDAENNGQRLRRLVVAQDTGGAIRGPVRGDLFWGFGPAAEAAAGTMRAIGTYYLLLPRAVTPSPQRVAMTR